MNQLAHPNPIPEPETFLKTPISPISCLTTAPPLIFHGQYETMVDPNIVLTPSGAPEIDVLAFDASERPIDDALRYAIVDNWTGENQQAFINQVRDLLRGKTAKLDQWRLWQVGIEGDYTLSLHFVGREDCPLPRLISVRLPLPWPLGLSFRIWEEGQRLCRHKLYVDMVWSNRYGRELKITEWRATKCLTQVTWWLDADEILMKDVTKSDSRPIEAFCHP